uniref:Replication factor A C-terminal domain-containing protein n=1 Tax=Tanacetum cinerariifolium TaxID=118510 RepID=A0A6L2JTT4_TANCI|nr:hypothetical protein [Tanacetum cinerariifolium]
MWARNRKNDVRIANVRTRKGWNFPSRGSENYKKGATRKLGKFWCDSCNKCVKILVLRYRLELDITDDTANAVVVMFDEPATTLVGCSAESVMEDDDEQTSLAPCIPLKLSLIPIMSMGPLKVSHKRDKPRELILRIQTVRTQAIQLCMLLTRKKGLVIEDSDAEANCATAEGGTRKKDGRHSK